MEDNREHVGVVYEDFRNINIEIVKCVIMTER